MACFLCLTFVALLHYGASLAEAQRMLTLPDHRGRMPRALLQTSGSSSAATCGSYTVTDACRNETFATAIAFEYPDGTTLSQGWRNVVPAEYVAVLGGNYSSSHTWESSTAGGVTYFNIQSASDSQDVYAGNCGQLQLCVSTRDGFAFIMDPAHGTADAWEYVYNDASYDSLAFTTCSAVGGETRNFFKPCSCDITLQGDACITANTAAATTASSLHSSSGSTPSASSSSSSSSSGNGTNAVADKAKPGFNPGALAGSGP
eukprot:jgi/Chrzof1/2108/Cz11g02300.t1